LKFRTKLILLTSLILLAGMLLTALIALLGINNLSGLALKEVEKGLVAANQEYFVNYSKANTLRTNVLLNEAVNEVQLLGDLAQKLEDNKDNLGELSNNPLLKDDLHLNPATGAYQSPANAASVASVLPYALDQNGQVRPEVLAALRQTSLFNLFLPLAEKNGLEKGQVLYFGPPDAPYVRSAPWNDYAGQTAKNFPADYRTKNLWDYSPGLIQSWEKKATQPGFKIDSPDLITLFAPSDGENEGLQMRFLRPIWNADRIRVRGAIGLDLALGQIVKPVDQVQIAKSGFAFLVQDDGRMVLKDDAQMNLLGFSGPVQDRPNLKTSRQPDIAGLSLPQDDKIIFKEIKLNGNRYYTVLSQLSPLNFFSDKQAGIGRGAWILGFIVPREELLASWYATEKTINDGTGNIIVFTLLASLVGLVVVAGVAYVLSNRTTRSLVALSNGAKQLQQKNYQTRVEIKSQDEFGQLGQAFNSMAAEIASYTANLEDLVRQRTAQLEAANQEINQLNEQLKSENVRLKAELEITRRLQQMILPKETELAAIHDLEIVGFMEPAEEVGGDYYDVLQQNGRVKIGIGDVTGHGLESGVLMIMVQTAIRTLLANKVTEPSDYLSVVNEAIYDNVQRMSSDKNLTLSLLDYKDGVLSLSGQHEDMIVVRADGTLEVINTLELGFPVGLTDDIASFVSQTQIRLNPEDVVVLYTDGITEAENPAKALYGFERLCQIVIANHHQSAEEIRNAIIEDLKDYIDVQKVYDDITLLVIKRKTAEVEQEQKELALA
jgi:sigma-B regulation protein RsbU (phosphoserine phosphatase)